MAEEASESTRYRLILKVATGGAATVWVGAVRGGLGFRQLVAIKKPHPHLYEVASVRDELINEARLASMIQHGNVVDVRDVDVSGEQINLVMDYIEGASLAELLRAAYLSDTTIPPRVILRIILDASAGLHAAHELVDEAGKPVGLVHRDVSPQNILVGLDGISRVADFGIAKAMRGTSEKTDEGLVKGKLAYMSPEYVTGKEFDRRADVFALATVCWEGLSGERCFKGESEMDTASRIVKSPARPLSQVNATLGVVLDEVLATAQERSQEKRYPTMAAFAAALEETAGSLLIGTHADVAATVKTLVGDALAERRAKVRAALAQDPALADIGVPSSRSLVASGPDSDSRSAKAVAITTPADELSSSALKPDVEISQALVVPRQRQWRLIVGVVCGAALALVAIALVVSSSKPKHDPVTTPTEKLAARSVPVTPPAVEPPPVVPEPPPSAVASVTPSAEPPVASAPVPRASVARPASSAKKPAASANTSSSPYTKW